MKKYYKVECVGGFNMGFSLAVYTTNGRQPNISNAEPISRREAIKIATENRKDTRLKGGPVGGTCVLPATLVELPEGYNPDDYGTPCEPDGYYEPGYMHYDGRARYVLTPYMSAQPAPLVADCSGYIFE